MSTASQVQKSITALVSGLIGWGAVVVASPAAAITAPEWLMLATVVATALGVYAVPNGAPAPPERPLRASRGGDAGLSLIEALVLLAIGVLLLFAFGVIHPAR